MICSLQGRLSRIINDYLQDLEFGGHLLAITHHSPTYLQQSATTRNNQNVWTGSGMNDGNLLDQKFAGPVEQTAVVPYESTVALGAMHECFMLEPSLILKLRA